MTLQRINYNGGYLWVDMKAKCPKGSNVIFPNTKNGVITDYEGCEVKVAQWNYAANGNSNLLVVAQSPNLSIPNVPYVEFEENIENDIEKCIKVVKSLIKDNCLDHTPYYGACVTCGRYENFDVLPPPEDVIEALEELIPSKGRYSEDDLRKAFKAARSRHWIGGRNFGHDENMEDDFENEDDYILSLNQPPLEIEIETRAYTVGEMSKMPIGTVNQNPVTYERDDKTYLKVKQ